MASNSLHVPVPYHVVVYEHKCSPLQPVTARACAEAESLKLCSTAIVRVVDVMAGARWGGNLGSQGSGHCAETKCRYDVNIQKRTHQAPAPYRG